MTEREGKSELELTMDEKERRDAMLEAHRRIDEILGPLKFNDRMAVLSMVVGEHLGAKCLELGEGSYNRACAMAKEGMQLFNGQAAETCVKRIAAHDGGRGNAPVN